MIHKTRKTLLSAFVALIATIVAFPEHGQTKTREEGDADFMVPQLSEDGWIGTKYGRSVPMIAVARFNMRKGEKLQDFFLRIGGTASAITDRLDAEICGRMEARKGRGTLVLFSSGARFSCPLIHGNGVSFHTHPNRIAGIPNETDLDLRESKLRMKIPVFAARSFSAADLQAGEGYLATAGKILHWDGRVIKEIGASDGPVTSIIDHATRRWEDGLSRLSPENHAFSTQHADLPDNREHSTEQNVLRPINAGEPLGLAILNIGRADVKGPRLKPYGSQPTP